MNMQFEKNKLKSYLGDSIYNELKRTNAIIAGGMITSIFSNSDINDVDVYFRNYDELYSFASENYGHIVSHTKKATQWLDTNVKLGNQVLIQVIHYQTFKSPVEIFENYDFTVCMGAFDFKTEEFILHEDFLKHNAQKIIKFNSGTAYPIISAIRLDKYKKKGYYVSKAEMIRVIMSCMSLNIESYEELKEHLGGMYGENYDRLFEDIKDDEFNMSKAIEYISNLSMSDSYFEEYKEVSYRSRDVLNDLDKGEKVGLKINNNTYRIIGGHLKSIAEDELDTIITIDEFIKGKSFYKFVNKDDDKLLSFYDKKFEYEVGEIAEAKNGKLYFNDAETIHNSFYSSRSSRVLIEVAIDAKDISEYNTRAITADKCLVLRVVPESEWKSINHNLSLPNDLKKNEMWF